MAHFIIAYHISLVNVTTNYCNNDILILDVKQLNKIMKLYYFNTLKALWDGQSKINVYYGMSRVKKQLSGKRSITIVLIRNRPYILVYFHVIFHSFFRSSSSQMPRKLYVIESKLRPTTLRILHSITYFPRMFSIELVIAVLQSLIKE